MTTYIYNCTGSDVDLFTQNQGSTSWTNLGLISNTAPFQYGFLGKGYNLSVGPVGGTAPTSASYPTTATNPGNLYFSSDAVSTTSCPANGGSSSSSMVYIIIAAVVVGVVALAALLYFLTKKRFL